MTNNLEAPTKSDRKPQPKLDDAETIILMAAVNRDDGMALPVPDSITASADQVARKIKRLIKLSFLEEVPAKLEDGLWRKSADDRHLTLKVTPLAFKVLGLDVPEAVKATGDQTVDVPVAAGISAASPTDKATPAVPTSRGKRVARKKPAKPSKRDNVSKTEALLTLLERPKGASLDELMRASGWQAHSVRGFLSAVVKKKLRLKLTSEEDDKGVRRYRVRPRAKT